MSEAMRFTPDAVRERVEPRAEILGAFNRGLNTLEKYAKLFKDDVKSRLDWTIQAIKSAQSKMDVEGMIDVKDAEGHIQKEGVPVDELMEMLDMARKNIEDKLREINKAAREHRLVDLYRAERDAGLVSPEFNVSVGGTYHSETDAARAWADSMENTALDIGLILKTLEKNSKKVGKRRELKLPPEPEAIPSPAPAPEAPRRAPEAPRTREAREEREETEIPEPETADIEPPNKPAFLIDISEIVRRLAMRQAEEKLNEYLTKNIIEKKSDEEKEQIKTEMEKKGFFGRLGSRVKEVGKTALKTMANLGERIYVRLSEKQYLEKFYQEALREIQANKNLLTQINARLIRRSEAKELSPNSFDKNTMALDEIINTYAQGVEEAEERGEKINDPQVNAELAVLFYRYATGELSDRKAFDAEVEAKVINRFFAKDASDKKDVKFSTEEARKNAAEGLLFAHNFFEMAKTYKTYIESKIKEAVERFGPENKEAVEGHVRALLALDIQLGLKEKDIRETKPAKVLTTLDKLIDKAQSIPVLGKVLASPTAWGAGTAAAVVLAVRRGIALPLSALAGAPGVGALFGGFIGATRRGRDLQYDRGLELRRKALGLEAGGERSAKMREYTQSMVEIDKAIPQIQALEKKSANTWSETEKRFVANLCARLTLEKKTQTDLFVAQKTEADQLEMRVGSMNNLKIALRRLIDGQPVMNRAMEQLMQEEGDKILIELERVDDRFKSFRRKEMFKAGVFGAVVGCVAGATAEAGIMAAKGEFGQSSLAKLSEYMYGHSHGSVAGHELAQTASGATHEVLIPGTDSKLVLPANLKLIESNGALNIVDDNGNVVVEHAGVDIDGRLDAFTSSKLEQMGFKVEQYTVVNTPETHIGTHEELIPGTGTKVVLPENLKFVASGDNISIVDDKGNIILDDLHRNANGGFDNQSMAKLHDAGWKVATNAKMIEGGMLFSGKLHEVQVPGLNTDVVLKLPEELNLAPDGHGGFDLVNQDNIPVAQGVQFTPEGRLTNDTLAMLKGSGWGLKEGLHTEELKVTDPNKMLEIMRHKYGEPGRIDGNRGFAGNVHPRSAQPTSTDNPVLQGHYKHVGHHPYEYTADEAGEATAKKAFDAGTIEQQPIKAGETVTGNIFEGKEVRGIFYDKPDEYVFSFKKGLLDMIKHGKVNWDQSIDDKYWIMKHAVDSARGNIAELSKHFSIRFYLTDPQYHLNQAFAMPLGPDGQLHIPKEMEELAKTLVDQKTGQLKVTWEVDYNRGPITKEDIAAGVTTRPLSLATERAHGVGVTEILTQKTTVTTELLSPKAPDQSLVDYHMAPPVEPPAIDTTTVLTPPEGTPLIPFPFVPRWAMERPKHSPDIMPPYGYYGSGYGGDMAGLGWEDDATRYSHFSETIKRNPEAKLDEAKEIKAYFERMDPKEKNFLVEMNNELGDSMDKECRAVITIPAYREEKHIGRTLEMFAKQKNKDGSPINPKSFEIIVFENSKTPDGKDNTEAIVKNFASMHPEMRIKYIYRQLPPDSTIGGIRKHLCDLAMLRSSQRSKQTGELALVHNDADTHFITDNYVESIINLFDAHPEADAFGGRNEWPKESFDKLPLFFAAKRFDQLIDIYFRTIQEKHPSMIGRNSGQRAKCYAAVGGFNPRCTLGEDLEMQRKIQHSRNWRVVEDVPNTDRSKDKREFIRKNRIRFLNNSYVESDPRRPIMKILKDSLGDEYGDWVQNDEVRGADWQDIIDKFPQFKKRLDFNKDNLERQLQAILDKWFNSPWVNKPQLRRFAERTFNLLGIDVELTGENQNKIKIKDMSKLEKGMANVRATGPKGKPVYTIGRKA